MTPTTRDRATLATLGLVVALVVLTVVRGPTATVKKAAPNATAGSIVTGTLPPRIATPATVETLPPLSAGQLAAYCEDPTVAAAEGGVWDAEYSNLTADLGVIKGETFAQRTARLDTWLNGKPARVAAARAALARAEASRPVPSGWHSDTLNLVCLSRQH